MIGLDKCLLEGKIYLFRPETTDLGNSLKFQNFTIRTFCANIKEYTENNVKYPNKLHYDS